MNCGPSEVVSLGDLGADLQLIVVEVLRLWFWAIPAGRAPCWKIDGRAIAEEIKEIIARRVMQLRAQVGAVPGLAVIQVGHNQVSDLYGRSKQLACAEVGIDSFAAYLPASASEEEVLELVSVLNADDRVHGILVQLPMPPVSNLPYTDFLVIFIIPYCLN